MTLSIAYVTGCTQCTVCTVYTAYSLGLKSGARHPTLGSIIIIRIMAKKRTHHVISWPENYFGLINNFVQNINDKLNGCFIVQNL